ncbi:MAG: hypothetical protein IK082_01160 [Oscillospiraceae bacterium]|nr:hypothetical protein [Oscillospiraceae bacterium]
MSTITTYAAARKNPFVWLAALLSIIAAVARIVFAARTGGMDFTDVVVRIILPVAANLFIAFRLPLRGEKQFYVTVVPVVILTLYLCIAGVSISGRVAMTLLCIIVSVVFSVLYCLTFMGKLSSKIIALLYFVIVCVLMGIDPQLRSFLTRYWPLNKALFTSDAAILGSILCCLLAAKKLPPWKEGDPYRLRFGDRLDGRRVRSMPVMSKVTPFFMANRLNRSNYIADTLEISHVEKYIRQKRKEGLKHFGLTHVIVAAYVRMIAEMPELNRFVAGQRIYHRYEISLNMVVKKEMNKNSPDSSIKVLFEPTDTAEDVYNRFDAALETAKEAGVTNGFDSITYVLDYLPAVVMSLFGFLVRFLDYFSLLPMALERVSPFHGSLFITSMGSLGIPPIYHHLYDFGTVPVFIAFGHKYTKYELNKEGQTEAKKYMDYKVVCDEGICDGFYYATAMKKLKSYMSHPERLDVPPETVVEDAE